MVATPLNLAYDVGTPPLGREYALRQKSVDKSPFFFYIEKVGVLAK